MVQAGAPLVGHPQVTLSRGPAAAGVAEDVFLTSEDA